MGDSSDNLPIDATRTVPAKALSWTAVRASGPGGQHVNRTESKVLLRFDPSEVPWLYPAALERLHKLPGVRLDQAGRLILTSQAHREQPRNLEDARQRLASLIRRALVRPKPRIATKPTRGSKKRRLKAKSERAETKQLRRKVRGDD